MRETLLTQVPFTLFSHLAHLIICLSVSFSWDYPVTPPFLIQLGWFSLLDPFPTKKTCHVITWVTDTLELLILHLYKRKIMKEKRKK